MGAVVLTCLVFLDLLGDCAPACDGVSGTENEY